MWKVLQRWLTPRLTELEASIVGATIEAVPTAARSLLRAQLADINRIDRELRETRLYPMKHGTVVREHLVPNVADELALCEVTLRRETSTEPLTATVWLTRGSLFSIELSHAPARGAYRVAGTRLLADPCAVPASPTRDPNVGTLPPWCREHAFTDLRAPLTEAARRRWREDLAIELPADYEALIASTDGARLGDRLVLGPGDAYRVRHGEDELVVIATIADVSILALRCGGDDTVLEVALDTGPAVSRGSRFAAAFLEPIATIER